MYFAITRTSDSGIPKTAAMLLRRGKTPCDASYTVSRLPSHSATVACGSIGLWNSAGVTYRLSSFTGAAPNAVSKEPRVVSGGLLFALFGV